MLWPVGAGRRTGVADGQTKILNCDCPAIRFTPAFHFCVSSQSRATLSCSTYARARTVHDLNFVVGTLTRVEGSLLSFALA